MTSFCSVIISKKSVRIAMVVDEDTKDLGKQIVELINKLNSMPEYKLLLRIKSLNISLYVFKRNYKELANLLTKHTDVREAIRLRGVGKKPEMRLELYEVARLLHNFVTSAKSLIDHTRIIYREIYEKKIYGETEAFPDYQDEVDRRFAKNPLAQFVEDLRDYCVHYKLPLVHSVLHYSQLPPTPIFESKMELNIEELNKYSRWSPLAKEYLSGQSESSNLLNVISEYYALVEDFHNWFRARQEKIHSQEFAKLASIQQKLKDLEKRT